jgi:hypothetical protein
MGETPRFSLFAGLPRILHILFHNGGAGHEPHQDHGAPLCQVGQGAARPAQIASDGHLEAVMQRCAFITLRGR